MQRYGVAALALILATTGSASSQEQPRFAAAVDLVQVDVIAVDGKGRTVADLRQADFEIREDGKVMEVVTFVPAVVRPRGDARTSPAPAASIPAPGRFIVLLLDDVFTSPLRTVNIRKVAHLIVDRLEPGDEMAVIALNGDAAVSTTDKTDLQAKVDRFTRERPPTMPGEHIRSIIDHSVETIGKLGLQLARVPNRRKSIVCIGAQTVFIPTVPTYAPGLPSSFSQHWFDAIRALSRANVSVYVIDPRGQPSGGADITQAVPEGVSAFGPPMPTATPKEASQSFTRATGGEAFVDTNFFGRAVDQIWREAGEYYLLGYYPPPPDGKLHSIAVSVKRKGVALRHRSSRG